MSPSGTKPLLTYLVPPDTREIPRYAEQVLNWWLEAINSLNCGRNFNTNSYLYSNKMFYRFFSSLPFLLLPCPTLCPKRCSVTVSSWLRLSAEFAQRWEGRRWQKSGYVWLPHLLPQGLSVSLPKPSSTPDAPARFQGPLCRLAPSDRPSVANPSGLPHPLFGPWLCPYLTVILFTSLPLPPWVCQKPD